MGMYSQAGAAVGGAIVTGIGNWIGANKANQGYRQYIREMDKRIKEAADHRRKLYYQDPTQTAESQAAVTQAQELLDDKTRQAEARNIVSGGTDESVALQKQAAAATVGNMMQQQAVAGAQKREDAWKEGADKMDAFTRYKAEAEKQRKLMQAQAIVNAANSSAEAQSELAKALPY